jgi:capsid protein
VDPTKDATASIDLFNNNMTTLKDIYGTRGKNWRSEIRQRAAEKKELDSLGLSAPAPVAPNQNQSALTPQQRTEVQTTLQNAIAELDDLR